MKEILEKLIEEYESFSIYCEKDFLNRKANCFDTNIPIVITNVTSEESVTDKLKDYFGELSVERKDGYIVGKPIPLFERNRFGYGDLIEIIRRLRDPDGCPWDRCQSPETIRTNIIEEAYELIEAVDLGDKDKICEECGDVLLQSAFLSVMTEEQGSLTNRDVITGICRKLIDRHTHIFGKDKANNEQEALLFWEKAKAKEKGQKGICDKLDSVPKTFTALQRANKVQKIIKKTGFDFPSTDEAIDKIYEEINEFKEAEGKDKEKEGGDMLFSVVNVLRMYNIDPEVVLNGTTARFEKRFRYVVEEAKKADKKLEEMTLEEMDKLYTEAKKYD